MAASSRTNNTKDSNKKDKVADSLRDEMELVTAASMELQKLKRQLRQTKSELSSSKITNRKTIQRQSKSIELLEKEKAACEAKLMFIKESQKPPQEVHKLIKKYHQALQKLEAIRQEQQIAKGELNEKDKKRLTRYRSQVAETSSKQTQDKLDQVMLQYNKILAKNVQLRLQLEEMMKIKEEFIRNLKLLQVERSLVKLSVDRLYEENAALFQQREEFRLKLNLLREKLEATRIQGQRDLREYRRLLNNDEKLNTFLEMKNQERPCLELLTRNNTQQTGDDQMTLKVVEEWRETLNSQCGHCNFDEIVQQYLHNLEQGYVMYGLIAQKNTEIDRLEDEVSDLEQSLEQHRSKCAQTTDKVFECNITSTSSRTPRKQEQELAIASQFMSKFQSILGFMEIQNALSENGYSLNFDFPKVIEQSNQACALLMERISYLVASVTSTDSSTNKQQWDYPTVPPLEHTSRSLVNSSESEESHTSQSPV